jgi:cytochrome b6-f complex iron-sulfur subunit
MMDRREFITLTAAASLCVAAGCPLLAAQSGPGQVIDAGPVGAYAKDGIYDAYRALGFFVISRGGKLSAISSFCTHRQVQLKAEPDGSFYCKRHGSTFDPAGHVTKGPAKRDLPSLPTTVSGSGHFLVTVGNG